MTAKAMPQSPQPITKKRANSWLVAIGLLVTGTGGAFLPWIWYESVVLQLTAPGLAEFVKFLPQVRTLQIEIARLHFLLPLFLAMMALPLFAINKQVVVPNWLRRLMRLAVIPFALAALSPVWKPDVLLNAEFRLQTLLAIVAIGLAVIAPLLKNIPVRILAIGFMAGGIAVIILPLQQFDLAQPGISEAYNESVRLGWGWWLTAGGMAMSSIGAIGLSLQIDTTRE